MPRKKQTQETVQAPANATPQGLGEASPAKTTGPTVVKLENDTKREDY